MPTIIVTHNVADVTAWLGHAAERADAIGQLGGTDVADHVAHDGAKTVAISAQVEDVGTFLAALASPSPELGAAMEKHGVQPPLTAYVAG